MVPALAQSGLFFGSSDIIEVLTRLDVGRGAKQLKYMEKHYNSAPVLTSKNGKHY